MIFRKLLFTLSLIMALCLIGCEKKANIADEILDEALRPFTLTGEITNGDDAIKRVLLYYRVDQTKKIDTAAVINGKYTFKGELKTYDRALIATLNEETKKRDVEITSNATIYIEPGEMNAVSDSIFSNLKLSGSIAHDEYVKWEATKHSVIDSINLYSSLSKELSTKMMTEINSTDSLTMAAYRGKAFYFMNKTVDYDIDYANNNINSPIIMSVIDNIYPKAKYEALRDSLFQRTPIRLQNSIYGLKIKNELALINGKTAPDVSLQNADNKQYKLSDYRGKYVLLDFWASWCAPCRAESPNLIAAFKHYENDFTIYQISIDKESARQAWIDAIEKDGTNLWPQVFNEKGTNADAAVLYGDIKVIPANFLIDKEGKIIAKNLRGKEVEAKLKELLGY